jgi:hypothetical protein
MREAALPVEVTRATLAVVEAELAVVREQKRGAEEEVREASSDEEHEALSARWFALTRGELRKKYRLDARLRITTEKLRPSKSAKGGCSRATRRSKRRGGNGLRPVAPRGKEQRAGRNVSRGGVRGHDKSVAGGDPRRPRRARARRLGHLGPKDPYATAIVLAAGEAQTVEEALDFRAVGKSAVEARQGFSLLPDGSA